MIDENLTFATYGYTSDTLSLQSHKKICVVCDACGKKRVNQFRDYRALCFECTTNTLKGENSHMYGKHHSEETKRKIGSKRIGTKHTLETRKKMSKNRSGDKNPMYGKHHTPETKKKISAANSGRISKLRGIKVSNITKQKISIANKGNIPWNKGIRHTEETKEKMCINHADYKLENHPNWRGGAKLTNARKAAKRRKLFGFNPLNNAHSGFDGHHVDFINVIFIPKELHISINHSMINGKNMDAINNKVCDWFLKYQGVHYD